MNAGVVIDMRLPDIYYIPLQKEVINIQLKPSLRTILYAVCQITGVSLAEFFSKSQEGYIVEARRIFSYYAYVIDHETFQSIGKFMNKNHATVLHHRNKILGFLSVPKDRRYYEDLIEQIKVLTRIYTVKSTMS